MLPALAVTRPRRRSLLGRQTHRVRGAPDLERADRLERLELQVDLGAGRHFVGVQANQRRPRSPRRRSAPAPPRSHATRSQRRPRSRSRARGPGRPHSSAAARSSTREAQRPEDRQLVLTTSSRRAARLAPPPAPPERGPRPRSRPTRSPADTRPPRCAATRGCRRTARTPPRSRRRARARWACWRRPR